MGDKYRFTGGVTTDSRPDRVEVESPSVDSPSGKVLELHDPAAGRYGNAEELTDDQVSKLSRYVTLERVTDAEIEAEGGQPVDQPGVSRVSTSTDSPPVTGHTPDKAELDAMNGEQLDAEIATIRQSNPAALPDLKGNAKLEEKRAALSDYYQNQGV